MKQSFTTLFIRGEALSFFWNAAVKAIGALNSLIVIAALSVRDFGLYHLTIATLGIAAGFIPDMFDDVIFAEMGRKLGENKKSEVRRLFGEYAILKIIFAFLLSALLFAASFTGSAYIPEGVAAYFRFLFILPLVGVFHSLMVLFFRAKVSFSGLPIDAIREAGKCALLVFFFFILGRKSPTEVLLAYFGSQLVVLMVLGVWCRREYRELFSGVPRDGAPRLRPLIRSYGVWAVGRYYVGQFSKNIKLWLVNFFVGVEAVGLLSVATTLYSMVVSVIPLGTLGMLFPRETVDRERFRHIFRRSMKYALWVSLGVAFVAAIGGPMAILVIIPKYIPAIPLFLILLVSLLFYGGFKVVRMALLALQEQKILFLRSLSISLMSPLLLVLLLPTVGIVGGALDFVILEAASLIIYYYYLVRSHPELRLTPRMFLSLDDYDRTFFRGLWDKTKTALWRRKPFS